VIASLWTRRTEADDDLVTGFYRNLEASGDIAAALFAAKRQFLQENRGLQENSGQESIDWARYQVFID